MATTRGPRIAPPPGQEYYHDDSCGERLVIRDDTLTEATALFCPRCQFSPDMQSIGLRPVGSTRGLRCLCGASSSPSSRLANGERRHSLNCPRRCMEEFEGSLCVRPRDHTGGHWNGDGYGYGPNQYQQSIHQYRWILRCYYCKKPRGAIPVCECVAVGEPHCPWDEQIVGPSSDLNCEAGIQMRKNIAEHPELFNCQYYGNSVTDEDARVTREAFERRLSLATTKELEKAFAEQERVMLSANDWLTIIQAELNLRRRTGKY